MGQQAVGAGSREPIGIFQFLQGEGNAGGHQFVAAVVVAASAAVQVQEPANDVGVEYFASIFVLEFLHAALGAAAAQGLPLLPAHLLQGYDFPEIKDKDKESGRNTARATLGSGLAVSAFPLDVPV